MKKHYTLLLVILFGLLSALPVVARDFTYTYEGQTLTYTVIDETAKTCRTKAGEDGTAGNNISGDLKIPAIAMDGNTEYTVTELGYGAFFRCNGLTSVEIPNSVTTFGDWAFCFCSGLTSVNIPNSVTTIGTYAFEDCSSLTSVAIPNSVTTIGNSAFSGCSGLTSVEIPNSVTTIGDGAFFSCSGLTSVEIPGSVTSIGSFAFYCCRGLTSVKIHNSVRLRSGVFANCSAIRTVEYTATNPRYAPENVFDYEVYVNAVLLVPEEAMDRAGMVLPWCCFDTIQAIEEEEPQPDIHDFTYTYEGQTLTYTIIDPVAKTCRTKAGISEEEGFSAGNINSGDLKIPAVALDGDIKYTVTEIGDYAFYGCSGLTSVNIPTTVNKIGMYAFSCCSGISKIYIPYSVTSIVNGAFAACSSLTSIEVDSSNRNYSTINGVLLNKDLSELIAFPAGRAGDYSIPNTVTYMGNWVFSGCNGLTSVKIPESVTTTGIYVFYNCNNIQSVKYTAFEPCILPANTFSEEIYDNAVLMVPEVALEKARATQPWCNFQNIQAIAEDVAANFSAAAEGIEMGLGDTAVLTLSLGKADEINGFQTDLTLPEGLTIAQNSRGKLNVTLGEGTSLKSHALVAQKVSGNNRYRIMVYSTKLETFVSGEGLLNITLESDDTFAGGEIIIDSTELNFAADYTEKPGEVRVPVSMLLYGDANDNGRLAIDDVVTEVLYIMENDPQPFSFKKADINRDMAISIADVMKTAGLVLNSSAATPAMNTVASAAATTREGEAPLTLGKVEFSNGKALLTISLGDVDDLTALQGTLILPEGVSVTDITLADAQVDRDHIVDHVENSTTRVSFAVYSLTADTLEPDAQVLDVELSCTDSFKGGNITLDGIMLVDTKAHGVEYDKVEVAVPDPAIATGIATVTAGDNAGVDVYNMQGILLMRHATAADIRTLAPGLYIIGGEKALIK